MKFLIAVLLILSVAACSPAQAGLWDSAVTSDWPTKEAQVRYKVGVYGYDVRVYEWTPVDNKDVRCVFVAGNENSSGVACYPVEEEKHRISSQSN